MMSINLNIHVLLSDTKSFLNGFPPHPYSMGHLPFMQLNHPLLPPPVTLAMAQQLGLRHDGIMGRDTSHLDSDRIPQMYVVMFLLFTLFRQMEFPIMIRIINLFLMQTVNI